VDDYELAYVATACWPSFVAPLLADWRSNSVKQEDAVEADIPSLRLPAETSRMRLVRYFTPTFTRALETLYPRKQHASEWVRSNESPSDLRLSELPIRSEQEEQNGRPVDQEPLPQLTTMAKFVLVAAFLASSNPAKTDIKLIGRAPADRKRRKGGGTRRTALGATAKVHISYYG